MVPRRSIFLGSSLLRKDQKLSAEQHFIHYQRNITMLKLTCYARPQKIWLTTFLLATLGCFVASAAGPLVALTGNGVTIADGDVTPDLADHTNFGDVPFFKSAARTYSITNAGDAIMNVSAINSTNSGTFVVSGIPATVAIGATETFQVTFNPAGVGTKNSSISIVSDDATSPHTYLVAGTGAYIVDAGDGGSPNVANDGDADSFLLNYIPGGGLALMEINGNIISAVPPGDVITINGSPDDDTLTLDLVGLPTMHTIFYNGNGGFDSLVLLNANFASMVYTPTTTTDGTVDLDGNILTFTGLSPITHSGTLANVTIDTIAAGAQVIDIDATATDTTVDANGGFETITFANATTSLTLNAGDGNDTINLNTYAGGTPITLTINGQTGDDTINMPYSVTTAGNTLVVSGSSHTAGDTLNFDPEGNGITVSGPSPGTITGIAAGTLSYDTIESIITVGEIDLLGNSNSITNGDPTPSALDHTDFGNAVVGLSAVTRIFTISNTGAASLNVSLPVTITGPGAAEFSVSSQPAALVAPGGNTTFNVLFNPSSSSTYTAQVNIVSNDSDENPYTYTIQGVGDPAPSTIPTLGEWGMVILSLLMGSFGLAYIRRESFAFATEGGSMKEEGGMMPFDATLFKKCLLVFAGITIAGFAASVAYMGHVQLSDAIGGPICAAVAAYFAHLVVLMKREQV